MKPEISQLKTEKTMKKKSMKKLLLFFLKSIKLTDYQK
jgi:hypothetical protein